MDRGELLQCHRPGRPTARLAHVAALRHVHCDTAGVAGLGVTGGERCRKAQRATRKTIDTVRIADDDVRTGMAADVQPEILRRSELEGDDIVVGSGAAHQNDETIP